MKKEARLNKRLAAYSAAAAAALAVAPATANAAVVYSGLQNLPVNSLTSQNIDLNTDGNIDFSISVSSWIGLSIRTSGISFIGEYSHADVANLSIGYPIQSVLPGTNYWDTESFDNLYGYNSSSGVFGGSTGYIGVSFNDSTQGCTVYGWIQFAHTGGLTGTVIDWAYEDTCRTAIGAGDGAINAVPTMGEWGMFALAGLLSAAAITAINREKEETA